MTSVRMVWHSEMVTKKVKMLIRSRLSRCGSVLRRAIVRNITRGKTRVSGPSKPGQFPHVDSGVLKSSIFSKLHDDGMGVRIGTTVKYGPWLEAGTRHMAPRPYLRRTLNESRRMLKMILAGQVGGTRGR